LDSHRPLELQYDGGISLEFDVKCIKRNT